MKKRSPYSVILLVLIMAFLGGCAWQQQYGPESPYYLPPIGSQILVNKPVIVRADKASAWLQNGEVLIFKDIDVYYPNCKFELNIVVIADHTVEPGSFTITHAYHEERFVTRPAIRLAMSFGFGLGGIMAGGDGGSSPIPYATVFDLRSDTQPDVLRMTCMHWEDPTDARFLTLSEIRQTLGDYISIIIE